MTCFHFTFILLSRGPRRKFKKVSDVEFNGKIDYFIRFQLYKQWNNFSRGQRCTVQKFPNFRFMTFMTRLRPRSRVMTFGWLPTTFLNTTMLVQALYVRSAAPRSPVYLFYFFKVQNYEKSHIFQVKTNIFTHFLSTCDQINGTIKKPVKFATR